MTQRELAERVGLRREAVTMIENGKRQVTVDELVRIAAAMNVAPVHLFVPLEDVEHVQIAGTAWPAVLVRAWARGETPLAAGSSDYIDYLAEIPGAELRAKIMGTQRAGESRLDREFESTEEQKQRAEDILWEIKEGDAIRAAEQRANERRKKEGNDG